MVDKQQVRRERRAARRVIAEGRDGADDDAALAETVVALVAERGLAAGSSVALYESYAVEPPTAATVAALTARGIRVLVPITLPDLDLDWSEAGDATRRPLGRDAIGTVDLVLAPGLSVDVGGTRLGQGGGCYDRALPRRAAGVPVLVVLHPGELVDAPLPRDAYDQPVDGVVTAAGTTWLRGRVEPAVDRREGGASSSGASPG